MRYRTAAVTLALLSLVLAPGCGPRSTGGGGHSLVLWTQMDPEERARFEKNLDAYRAQHPAVDIQFVPYDTENLRQQFISAASGGGGPQLIFGPSDQVGPLSIAGLIRPLDEAMPAGWFDRFLPQALDTLDRHIWAAPDQVGNHLTLVYNRALVPNPPATHAEFLRAAKAATHGDVYGFAMNFGEPYWLAPFLTGFGGWVMDDAHEPTLDTPAMRKALVYLDDLKNKQGICPRESDYQIAETLFMEGKAAMIVNGPWSWSAYRKAGIDFGIAPLWTLPGGGRAQPMTASKGYSINANTKGADLEQAIALVDYLTSAQAELRDAVALGVLPSRRDAWSDATIQSDPTLRISQQAFELGRRMPVVPEMRVIWDSMRPGMQQVMNGSRTPEAASREMQKAALQQIRAMKK